MEDSKIIDLFFERSEQAIIELSQKYGAACVSLADNILGDKCDAEECVNDAYLAVWDTVPPQRPDSLSAYLGGIVRKRAIAKYHANTAQKRHNSLDVALDELEECLASTSFVEEQADADALAEKLNAFLGSLDEESRNLFVRRYWQADSMQDLAALFHTSEGNVRVRLTRIRKKLKEYLIKEEIYP